MSWVKNREEFKQAVLSTARAVSKNPGLESTAQGSSRPPSLSQISLQYPPRSSSQIDAWRGEGDFQGDGKARKPSRVHAGDGPDRCRRFW